MSLLSSLPFTVEDVIMIINIVFLVILLLCALIGFCRGTKKSLFYMISTLIFLVGGFFLSDVICNALLSIDLSSYDLSLPLGENEEYPINGTLKDLLIVILDAKLFGGNAAGTATLTLLIGVVQLAFRIVWFLLLIILSFTLFKWISDIIWLFFRPKKQVVPGKKRKKRPKPKIGSRLGGAGIGMCKGLLYGLLLFFIIAGLISIVETYSEVTSNNEEVSYNMVITPNSATLVKLNSEGDNPLDEYQEIIDMLLAYKKSAPGIIYGTIEIKGSSIDEYMFDELLKINVDGLDTNFKLRQEIKKIAEAFAECPELLSQGFSTEVLIEMTKDPEQNAKLKAALAKLTDLEIINIAIPVTLELVLLSDMVLESIEDDDLKEQIANLDIEALKQIDYGAEFKNLGYAFVDIISLLDDEQQVDFLSMNTETIDAIFDSIGKLELIDYFAPIAINYVLTSEDVQAMFTELGIDSSDLGFGDITDWSGEVEILGDILTAFLEIGLTNEDLEDFTQIEINEDFCEKIDNFTEVLFTSNIIKNAIPVVGNFAINQLPEEYAEIVSIPSDADSEFWQGELKPLLKAALALLSTGILTPEEGTEPQDVIAEMSDDKITELASYLSQSTILTNSLNNIINTLVSAKVDEDGNVIEEGMLGDIVLVGFESANEWNETEIYSIFKALVTILKSDIIGSEDYVNTLSTLSNETINDLASSLSGSKFIRNNLSEIISFLLKNMNEGGTELEIVVLEADEWDKEELLNIFFLFREIASSGLLDSESDNVFAELSDESIDNIAKYMSGSKFITMNLTPIMDMLLSSMDLGEIEIKGFEDYRDWTELEISSLFKSAKIIINYTDDLTQLIKLSEDELDILTSSTIVSNILVDFITEYSKEGGELELIEGTELVVEGGWVDTREDVEFTYNSGVITVTSDAEIDTDKYYVYVLNEDGNYEKVTSSTNGVIDLNNYVSSAARRRIQRLPQANEIKVTAFEFGEIRSMFLAVQAICKDNEISADSIMDALSSVTEDDMYKILDSIVISETLIYQIEEIASETDALVCIPEGDLKAINPDGTKDRTAWYEQEDGTHGELFNALKAMSILFNGENFSNLTFDTDMFTSIEDDDISIVLKSKIINETLIVKIDEMTDEASGAIYIPSELITDDEIDRVKWNANSESINLLKSLKKLFSGSSIDVNNISIYNLIENEVEILKSLVVTETIKRNILDIDVIEVPSDLSTDTLDGWKNIYVNDSISQRGELSYLLRGIKVALSVDENTTLETIQSEEINLTSIVDDRDDILISKVLSETIKEKIITTEGISLPQNYTDPTDKYNYINWYNTYNGEVLLTRGEIDALLASADIMFGGGEINFDNISLYNVIENRDEVLKSLIISETIKQKVLEMNEIKVPTSKLEENTLEGWSNTYDNSEIVYGELNYLLRGIKYALSVDENTTLDSIQSKEINLTNIVDDRNMILRSLVLSETIKEKIITTEGISLPNNYTDSNDEYNYIVWDNKYETNDEIPSSKGEIDALLASADLMFNGGEIDFDNISLYNVIENRDEVLKSLIISETIKDKVVEMEEIKVPENLDVNTLEGWSNTYASSEIIYGELNYLLRAIKYVLNVDENTTLDSITGQTIGFTNLVDERDIILLSNVFTETIKEKIITTEGISLPQNYTDSTDEYNYIIWNNTYVNEVVVTRGEIDALLASADLMFGDDEIDFENVPLNSVIINRDEILKSIIISETIKDKVVEIDEIKVPDTLDVNTLEGWSNTYSNGTVSEYGELNYLLKAIKIALNVDENTKLDSIQNQEITLTSIVDDRDEVLISKVLSETIKEKIITTEGISLPNNYTDSTDEHNYINWHNTYVNEIVATRGEIDALLAAADLMFGDEEIDFENVPLNSVIINRDEVLKSLIISETIKDKVVEMDEIKVPETLDVNTLEGWRNTYVSSEVVYGELNYLLKAIKIALNVDENTKLNSIQSNELGLSSIIDDRDIVLRSLVFSETIKFKIINNDNLNKPSEWNKETNVHNYIVWDNKYESNDEVPSSRGEIDALLAACKHMFGDNEINFDNLGQFEYSILFNDAEIRKTILTSKIVSEIMIVKIEGMIASDSMHIPGEERVPGLHDVNNRTLWWNLEYGELTHFIEGSSHLLTDKEKENLENLVFGVDKVYNHMMNEEEREIIVKSYILSETLSDNFKELDLYTQHEAHVDEIGVELANNYEWYGIEIVGNQRIIEKKELWHLISSIKVILGDTYTSEKAFELDDIFGTDADHRSPLAPTEDEVHGQHYFSFDWTNMDVFLESLLMQTIFEDVLFATIDDGELNGKIVAPTYGYTVGGTNYLRFEYTYNKYKNENPESFNDDELKNLVEYDTKRMIEAIIIMNIAGLNYDELSHFEGSISGIDQAMALIETLENITWAVLVDAFFISRAFRGSIESILNPVFATVYQFAYTYAMYNGSPIPAWDSVKLQNADYAYPLTKEQGAELLLNDINSILDNISSVS